MTATISPNSDNNAPSGDSRKAQALAAQHKLAFLRDQTRLLETSFDHLEDYEKSLIAAFRAGKQRGELEIQSHLQWLESFATIQEVIRRMAMEAKHRHLRGKGKNSKSTKATLAKVARSDSQVMLFGRDAFTNGVRLANKNADLAKEAQKIHEKLLDKARATQSYQRTKPKARTSLSPDDLAKTHVKFARKTASSPASRHHKHLRDIEELDNRMQ